MGMLIGLFQASGTETPDPVIGGNAVGKTDIHQPLQITIQADPIYRARDACFQTLLDLGMAQGLLGVQKRPVNSNA